jgi:hypothetical protein
MEESFKAEGLLGGTSFEAVVINWEAGTMLPSAAACYIDAAVEKGRLSGALLVWNETKPSHSWRKTTFRV